MRGKGKENFSVRVLTKERKRLAERQGDHPSEQQFYAGFVKPQEVAHEAALYRTYQAEAAEIEKGGGTIRRVVLDYELKKSIYAPLVKIKLMGLDFVLAHPEHRHLATETETLEFFVGALGLKREWLPLRIYRSRNGRTQTTRYFVDKFPLFLSGAPIAPAPVVTFCCVDGNLGKPAGFDTHLLEYRELFARMESVQMVYVSTDRWTFAKAERIFRRLCGTLAAKSARGPSDPDLDRLLGHFRARVLLERRETTCFNKQQLDRLRDELREFRGPEHEELYRIWRELGDGAVLCGMHGLRWHPCRVWARPRLRVLWSTSQGGAGMKRTDYFRRRQNPHKDPGLNALVAGFAPNDTTGCRRAMLRETQTAKQFKGGSDPGLCGP